MTLSWLGPVSVSLMIGLFLGGCLATPDPGDEGSYLVVFFAGEIHGTDANNTRDGWTCSFVRSSEVDEAEQTIVYDPTYVRMPSDPHVVVVPGGNFFHPLPKPCPPFGRLSGWGEDSFQLEVAISPFYWSQGFGRQGDVVRFGNETIVVGEQLVFDVDEVVDGLHYTGHLSVRNAGLWPSSKLTEATPLPPPDHDNPFPVVLLTGSIQGTNPQGSSYPGAGCTPAANDPRGMYRIDYANETIAYDQSRLSVPERPASVLILDGFFVHGKTMPCSPFESLHFTEDEAVTATLAVDPFHAAVPYQLQGGLVVVSNVMLGAGDTWTVEINETQGGFHYTGFLSLINLGYWNTSHLIGFDSPQELYARYPVPDKWNPTPP